MRCMKISYGLLLTRKKPVLIGPNPARSKQWRARGDWEKRNKKGGFFLKNRYPKRILMCGFYEVL
jgi:hypothetical protein